MLESREGSQFGKGGSPPRLAFSEGLGISGRAKRSSVAPLLPLGTPIDVVKHTAGESPPAMVARGHRGSIPRAPAGVSSASEMSLLRKKAGKIEDFVPELIVRHICTGIESGSPVEPPTVEHFPAVAMFADLSGFTMLSESLAAKGGLGAETLGFWLNRYFELLVKIVAKSGGDVFKFAGDALVVLWPPEPADERDTSPTRGSTFSPVSGASNLIFIWITTYISSLRLLPLVHLRKLQYELCVVMHSDLFEWPAYYFEFVWYFDVRLA